MRPGEYLVLKFDFSIVDRCPDLDKAAGGLAEYINQTVLEFYEKYGEYLGRSADQLISENMNSMYPINNLGKLVRTVDKAIKKAIRSGDEKHPLANLKGVCD